MPSIQTLFPISTAFYATTDDCFPLARQLSRFSRSAMQVDILDNFSFT